MFLVNVMAISVDGEIAAEPLEDNDGRVTVGLSNAYDQKLVDDELASCDAVILGAESVRAAGKLRPVKNRLGVYPMWVIFTVKGLDMSLPFWQQKNIPRLVVSPTPVKLHGDTVMNLNYQDKKPGEYILGHLKELGAEKVLLFGGGQINKIFYDENLVDEVKITLAPLLLGQGIARFLGTPLLSPRRLQLLNFHEMDDFLYLHYRVEKE
ncbi:MAG: dihydrofolate reductase family protein [Deltaproteobacteria bacterium]|nr:dihydrofolate reductase family protein [Deltaproteobacteria bacterium]